MKRKQETVCHTCRSHKIGCDGKRPICSQCSLTGRRCAGYQLETVFVEYAPRASARRREKAPCSSCPVMLQSKSDQAAFAIASSTQMSSGRDTSVNLIPRSISTATSEEFAAVIVSCFVPGNKPNPLSFDPSATQICGAWVDMLPQLVRTTRSGKLLCSAVTTFGTAILDKGPEGKSKSFRSLQAHAATLKALKSALARHDSVFSIETAIAILCLAMVELMLPTSKDGVDAHFNGLGILMEAYPPELYSSGIVHLIFAGCRPVMLFHSIGARKSTFLEKERWKVGPFRHHAPSIMQMLLSDVAILPSVLEEVDLLWTHPCNTAVLQNMAILKAQQAKGKLGEISRHLSQWEEHLKRHICYCRSSQALDSVPNTGLSNGFTGLLSANVHIHVWAFQIICLVEAEKVDLYLLHCGGGDLLNASGIRERNDVEVLRVAVKILQSIEYMLQEERKLYGPAASLFPLRTAYAALQRDPNGNSEHVERCWELVRLIRCKGFQADLVFERTPTTETVSRS